MGLFDRISRVIRGNLNDIVSKAEEPEKILEQSIIDMQEDLVQLRQAVAQSIASQKRTQKQYEEAEAQAKSWYQRAQLALAKGDENLAREALVRKKTQSESAAALKISLDQQNTQVDTLKRNLVALESKISEAKAKKDILKARISAAKAQEQLQTAVGNMNTGSAMSAFERMEEKVLMMEARAQSAGELAGADLESQFAQLEAGSDIDDELALLKGQIAAAPAQQSLPQSSSTAKPQGQQPVEVVDLELEELRSQIKP